MFVNIVARVAITLAALGFFCVLRVDIAAKTWNRMRSSHTIAEYVKNNSVRKLQIGAGDFSLPGWLNTDIDPQWGQAFLDATKPFPLPDSSFQLVFGEQLIEHLSYEQGLEMMKQSFRILKRGGKIRMATPDLLKLEDLTREDKTPEQLAYISNKLRWHHWATTPDPASYILNSEMHEFGHRFLYSPKVLKSSLEAAGFTQVRQYLSGESDNPALKGLEVRSYSDVRSVDRYETMAFEGVRP